MLSAALMLTLGSSVAQSDLGPPLTLRNGSFEDMPRQGHAPSGWFDCSFSDETPVDVHPGTAAATGEAFFGVDNRPFDGNTYLGMVVRDNETYEAVSQRIPGGPLKAGKCYTFSIYLAQEDAYLSQSKTAGNLVNYSNPAKLRIFGGRSYCNRGEVIAESAPVKNNEWLQYNFRFEPKADHDFIVLEAYYKTPVLFPYNGNLLLDKAGDIVPVACDDEEPVEEPLAEQPVAEVPTTSPPVAEVPVTKPAVTRATQPQAKATPTQRQEARLQGLKRSDLRAGSVVRVEKLFFKADSSAVSPDSRPVLEEIFSFLDQNPDVVIEVGGHTNGIPPHEFCDVLSTERAESVVNYLIAQGIDNRRLFAKGYGKRKPVATNKTPTGRKRNQRVEIKVLSIGG